MQCGRFGSDPPYVAVLIKCSVAILVVAVLVAKRFVAVLGVAVLECGRFDQDPKCDRVAAQSWLEASTLLSRSLKVEGAHSLANQHGSGWNPQDMFS